MPKQPLSSRLTRTAGALALAMLSTWAQAQTALADQPLFTNNAIPGNLALALSVEFPTAVSVAHIGNYSAARTYLGYFDPAKCYTYRSSSSDSTLAPNTTSPDSYFFPDGLASAAHTCSGKWSGNFLNWATMQTIDPFRWALTGGTRVIDTASTTVLEKAWASGQGGTGNFPNRSISGAVVTGATPLGLNTVNLRVEGLGNKLRFTYQGDLYSSTTYHYSNSAPTNSRVYEVFARVKVCDSSGGAGGVESNCRAYGSNYKPEGLIQRYSDRIRYSAFGYLNDSNILRDGGVLRARQKFVGPTQPVPGSPPAANARREWDASTGVFTINPDATDATATATLFNTPIANSGVINYLNKFGRSSSAYKTYDPVGELYYAAVRYFKNLGNVASWTNVPGGTSAATRATWADDFPVITTWDDPIQYSCQRNFILGIGDVNTHADANVPGTGTPTGNEPTKPSFGDPLNAVLATNKIGSLEGIGGGSLGTVNPYGGCCNNNTALMAGIAYDSHTRDIRPDDNTQLNTIGMQTISTYWLDVMEYQTMKSNNQFLLAAKYGGFAVPDGFNPYTNTAALPLASWHTTTDVLPDGTPRPDNYFTAGAPDLMIAGLNAAFSDIASRIRAYTTSFSTTLPQVSQTGNGSYSTQYDSQTWTGEVQANILSFDTVTGDPVLSPTASWIFSNELGTQASGNGWNTNRRIASWDPASGTAVAFRSSGGSRLTSAQLAALNTTMVAGDDSANYLNYLRGDRTNEGVYRTRTKLVGDIVGSKAVPVGQPDYPFVDSYNPGYSQFKTLHANRRTVVYVGANDGMLHAINGALQRTTPTPDNGLETDPNAGQEMFAYVPSPLYQGPNNTPATDGLAAFGRSPYVHKYFVNATPVTFDVDFWRTPNPTAASADWHTILVGGLGKGGKSYYALDVTDPETMALSEANLVNKVLWEFTNTHMGYSYGDALIGKTKKFGWVVVLTSGYNNDDGYGYLFFINPRTGELLETVRTPTASNGMAHLNGYVETYRDGTMDAIYSTDLDGNIWRLDITSDTGTYPQPQLFAVLTDINGNRQPITTKPIIEVDPRSNRRFVMVGTGKLLDSTDITSTLTNDFYAITDGMRNFGGFATIGGTPLGKTNLVAVADTLAGANVDYQTQRGWYIPLTTLRVVTRPSAYYGSVTFVATSVDNSDACSPSGVSRIFGVDFSNALTLLRSAVTNDPLAFLQTASNVTDIRDLSVNGRREIIFGDDRGGLSQARSSPAPAQASRRLNWREVQN
ncbi:MAG: pilus assembly protein [Rhizobacter sp.]|nr:pilus assembly protein [Rhizobacter sp.]